MSNFDIKKLNFTVLGAGKSGIACAQLIQKFGGRVFVSEHNALSLENETLLTRAGLTFEHRGHSTQKILTSTDVLVVSPGIPLSSPLVLSAKLQGICVTSEVEAASWFFPAHFICLGITGTNGKSTATNYLSHLLGLEHQAVACGNIGTSVSEVVLDYVLAHDPLTVGSPPFYLCIELSSYQLEATHSLPLHASCFLNLQNDHLGRYETLEEYMKAKWRMVLLTKKDGLAVIEKNVLNFAVKLGLSLPQCEIKVVDTQHTSCAQTFPNKTLPKFISQKMALGKTLPVSVYQELKYLPLENLFSPNVFEHVTLDYTRATNGACVHDDTHWTVQNSCLPGAHNVFNILCASLMAHHCGISTPVILSQWEKDTSSYVQLPHRLESIGKPDQIFIDSHSLKKNVEIINDSKATNVESTLVALASFTKPIHLLLGGQAKGDSYLPLMKYFGHPVVKIYAFGAAGPLICDELKNAPQLMPAPFPTLLCAAHAALNHSKDGEIILLSPACSSFDEFKNFEERGAAFRTWATSCFEEKKSHE